MKLSKRVLALLLAVVMIVGVLPVHTFAADEESTTTPDTVTVTVNFVYERNNAMVAAPWSASIPYGGSLTEPVTVPGAIGYHAPAEKFTGPSEPDATIANVIGKDSDGNITSLTVNASNIKEDISFTVFYVGNNVKYVYTHNLQKLENDEYEEVGRTEVSGAIDYIPEIPTNTYEGFYFASKSQSVIGGVTYVNYLYNRNYHLVTFDPNGGYNAPDPMYVKYGTSIDLNSFAAPERDDRYYDFGGWYIGDQRYYQVDAVKGDITLTAKWNPKVEEANVTYVLWGENADGTGYDWLDTLHGDTYIGTVGGEISFADQNCDITEHVHGSACATCDDPSSDHVHTVECYSCVAHPQQHDKTCYPKEFTIDGKAITMSYDLLTSIDDGHSGFEPLWLTGNGILSSIVPSGVKETFGKYTLYPNGIVTASDNCFGTSAHENGRVCLLYRGNRWYTVDLTQRQADNLDGMIVECLAANSNYYGHSCQDACINAMKCVYSYKDEYSSEEITATEYLSSCTTSLCNNEKGKVAKTPMVESLYFALVDGMKTEKDYGDFYKYPNGEIWGNSANTFGTIRFIKKINGNWLYITPSGVSHKQYAGEYEIPECGLSYHTHGNGTCTYDCGRHVHSDACYADCELQEHTHTSDCYKNVKYQYDENLWIFKHTTTEEVEADGSTVINAYFDRTVKTINFYWDPDTSTYDSAYGGYTKYDQTLSITDRWGADISSQWIAVNDMAKRNLWGPTPDGGGPWTSYLELMPKSDQNYYCVYYTSNKDTATYYIQTPESALAGGDPVYELKLTVNAYYSGLTNTMEDIYPMTGFTFAGLDKGEADGVIDYTYSDIDWTEGSSKTYGNFNGSKFYYNRNKNNLVFYSPDASTVYESHEVSYGSPLNQYSITPDRTQAVTSLYGKDAVFLGWYQNPQCTGEKYDFVSRVMPDVDVPLFAKWVSGVYNVNTYTDETCTTFYTYQGYNGEQHDIPVNEYAVMPIDPVKEGEIFVGWAYKEGDTEHLFSFDMPITKNYDLYPKFSTNVAVDYVVHYYLDGTTTKVAEDKAGSEQIGSTVVENAKLGDELTLLDADLRSKYFPDKLSVAIPLTGDGMEIIFYYKEVTEVEYTVRYQTADGKDIIDPVTTKTSNAVVTAQYKPIEGYAPRQYQIKLYLTTDFTKNIITFVYDSVAKINYAVAGEGGTVDPAEEAVLNDDNAVGSTATAADGYMFVGWYTDAECTDADKVSENAAFVPERDAEGKFAETYYAKFVKAATVNIWYVDKDKMSTLKFKSMTVPSGTIMSTTNDEAIDGYEYLRNGGYENQILTEAQVLADTEWYALIIEGWSSGQAEVTESGLTIAYYYRKIPDTATVSYKVAGAGGSVSPNSEPVTIGGDAKGSTATPDEGYAFAGWYSDEDCKNLVSSNLTYAPQDVQENATYYAKFEAMVQTIEYVASEGGKVDPANETVTGANAAQGSTATANKGYCFDGWFTDKEHTKSVDTNWVEGGKLTPVAGEDGTFAVTKFYAKFTKVVGNLTIKATGTNSTDENQSFIYTVSGPNGFSMDVVVPGDGQVTIADLPIGTYTVTAKNGESGWAWRYGAESKTVELPATGATVDFTHSRLAEMIYWLNGCWYESNKFGAATNE